MKIVKTRLPVPGGLGMAVINTLADSWYEKGLSPQDIGDLNAVSPRTVGLVLDELVDQGLVEVKTAKPLGYVLTERCRELLREA